MQPTQVTSTVLSVGGDEYTVVTARSAVLWTETTWKKVGGRWLPVSSAWGMA